MSTLSLLLSSGVKAELFRLLFGLNDQELHVRELQRQSGFALSTVRQELKNLEALGLVTSRVSGNRTYYRGNQRHPLYPDIHGLVLKTNGLADVIRESLGQDSIHMAFVYGSMASGKETADSDIDLMVIGSLSLRELTKRMAGISERVGRELNPSIMTETEFRQRVEANDHFVMAIVAAPKLFVIGDMDELSAVGEERLDSSTPN